MKKYYYPGLWLATALAAALLGAFGGWMVALVTGDTVHATVDACYKTAGWNDEPFARCEGNWHHTQSYGNGNTTYVASGPVVGLDVDPRASVVSSDGKLAGDYPGTYFAVLNGDSAVVVPRYHLVLGPLGLLVLVSCGVGLVFLRRRDAPDDLSGWPNAMREVDA